MSALVPPPALSPDDPLAPQLALFDACHQRHLALVPEQAGNMLLKRDHCLRVLGEARAITASLGAAPLLTPDLEHAVHVAALYHDTGRFVQLARWGTFNDTVSANHGALGVLALRSCGLLAGLDPSAARLVRATTAMHNRRDVPGGLPPRIDLSLRVVRDADKLDILRVMLAQFDSGEDNDVVTLGLERDDTGYTPSMLARLEEGRLGAYEEMHTVNDFKLLLLSWVHGLEFPASRRAFRDRGYLRRLADELPRTAPFDGLCDRLSAVLDRD